MCFYLKHSAECFKYQAGCFLSGRVFGLKTSDPVFYIKSSRLSFLKHPTGCLHFKHLPGILPSFLKFGHKIILRQIWWSLYFVFKKTHEVLRNMLLRIANKNKNKNDWAIPLYLAILYGYCPLTKLLNPLDTEGGFRGRWTPIGICLLFFHIC